MASRDWYGSNSRDRCGGPQPREKGRCGTLRATVQPGRNAWPVRARAAALIGLAPAVFGACDAVLEPGLDRESGTEHRAGPDVPESGSSAIDVGNAGLADAAHPLDAAAVVGAPDANGAAPAATDAALEGEAGLAPPRAEAAARDVMIVGNGVSGSVSFIDARAFRNLGSVDVVPDLDEVMALMQADPLAVLGYEAITQFQTLTHFEPAGGKRFVDDMCVSPDGTRLYVSRSNLGDVAAFDLTRADHPRLWRTPLAGGQSNHVALSPDGRHFVVSDPGAGLVRVLDASSGEPVGEYAAGTAPHQNDYSLDGKYIFTSSVGLVHPALPYALNAIKGDRLLVKVDAETFEVLETWSFEYGVRPNVIGSDGSTFYTQLSYLNGVVKYDLISGREISRSDQPLSAFALANYPTPDDYPHDSAHHGLALSGDGERLCDCGTIDNSVSIVTTADMRLQTVTEVGLVPYWATTGPDGRFCFVSVAGADNVTVVEFESGRIEAVVPAGSFPHRTRLGKLPHVVLNNLRPEPG